MSQADYDDDYDEEDYDDDWDDEDDEDEEDDYDDEDDDEDDEYYDDDYWTDATHPRTSSVPHVLFPQPSLFYLETGGDCSECPISQRRTASALETASKT